MKFKDLLVIAGIALLISWTLDYFVLSRFRPEDETKASIAGTVFQAPDQKVVLEPLYTEIDFIDTKRMYPERLTTIETRWARIDFSSDGAAIERLTSKRMQSGHEQEIVTIFPTSREDKAFLIALDERTPYYFELIQQIETPDEFQLTYRGSFGDGQLIKRYTVAKNVHKIDVSIELNVADASIQTRARLFVTAPFMQDLAHDTISGLIGTPKGGIEQIAYNKIAFNNGWWSPSLFGAENKYFVHALVGDHDQFVRRAYFSKTNEERLLSVFETATTQGNQSWTVSFYCGPKDAIAMAPVDQRLEQTLGYSGILAPLAKLLLVCLNFINDYVGNYGFSIILLTLSIGLIMFPFGLRGQKSMKKTGDMQRRMKHLEQKYKNDPERLRIEQLAVMKQQTLPFLGGCLPALIKIPIFFALNKVLSHSIELYQAPFVGWIHDLSMPDPYYVLPIFLVLMMLSNAFTVDKKQRTVMLGVAVMVGIFSIHFSAGLLLFIMFSTFLHVAQNFLQQKVA